MKNRGKSNFRYRYATCMSVLGVRKASDEGYMEYLTRLTDTRDRID